ncbi:MAG: hypothetical protein WDW38_006310 [Sanguina aurantia]
MCLLQQQQRQQQQWRPQRQRRRQGLAQPQPSPVLRTRLGPCMLEGAQRRRRQQLGHAQHRPALGLLRPRPRDEQWVNDDPSSGDDDSALSPILPASPPSAPHHSGHPHTPDSQRGAAQQGRLSLGANRRRLGLVRSLQQGLRSQQQQQQQSQSPLQGLQWQGKDTDTQWETAVTCQHRRRQQQQRQRRLDICRRSNDTQQRSPITARRSHRMNPMDAQPQQPQQQRQQQLLQDLQQPPLPQQQQQQQHVASPIPGSSRPDARGTVQHSVPPISHMPRTTTALQPSVPVHPPSLQHAPTAPTHTQTPEPPAATGVSAAGTPAWARAWQLTPSSDQQQQQDQRQHAWAFGSARTASPTTPPPQHTPLQHTPPVTTLRASGSPAVIPRTPLSSDAQLRGRGGPGDGTSWFSSVKKAVTGTDGGASRVSETPARDQNGDTNLANSRSSHGSLIDLEAACQVPFSLVPAEQAASPVALKPTGLDFDFAEFAQGAGDRDEEAELQMMLRGSLAKQPPWRLNK